MIKKIPLKLLFCLVMFALFVIFAALYIQSPYGKQSKIFFLGGENFLADFLNPLIYVRDLSPYFNKVNGFQTKQSLPLVWLLYYPFTLPVKKAASTLQALWQDPGAMYGAIFFVFACTLFLFFNLRKMLVSQKYNLLILAALFLSGINIFSMERGNIIILSAAFLALFLNNYEKEDAASRFIAIFSLSMCGVLKIFPLIFGLLWLYKKRYRDLLYAAALTLALALAPFFLLEGGFVKNFKQARICVTMSQYALGVSQSFPRFSLENCVFIMTHNVNYILGQILIVLTQIFTFMLAAYSIILAAFVEEKWKQIALLTLCLLFIPTQSALYTGLYLFPSIILFFNRSEYKKIDYFYMFFFCLFLCPVQFRTSDNYLYTNAALLLLWLTLVFEQNKLYDKDIRIFYGKLCTSIFARKSANNRTA